MVEGTLKTIYSRGTRKTRSPVWGQIELKNGTMIEFQKSHLNSDLWKKNEFENLSEFNVEEMMGDWINKPVEFEIDGNQIVEKSLRKK